MALNVIRETERFALVRDGLMGVNRYMRKADGAVTYWNTGSDALDEIEQVAAMCDDEFELQAEGMIYHD